MKTNLTVPPRPMLTVKELQRLKPAKKQYKRSDEKRLFVIVRPNGAIWWRFKYRWGDREKALSFGTYPDVSLKRAREKRDEARTLLDHGIDPSAGRKAKKAAASADTDTFKSVPEDWMSKGCPPRKGRRPLFDITVGKMRWILDKKLYPALGNRPVDAVEPPELLTVLRKVESDGKHETASLDSHGARFR